MVLIKPIPGQEVRNSDFLLEEGAAVRCNYETTVGYKLDQLLDEPDRLRHMAASARRLGRPDAAELIVATALADPPTPLWISRAAQQAILAGAEEGVSAREGAAERRVLILVEATSGISVGVATLEQIQTLAHTSTAEAILDAALSVTPAALAELARQGADLDLLAILRQALGSAEEVTIALGD
jgi:processive 1,2-diacylglycerol beta-glucosyltransferase